MTHSTSSVKRAAKQLLSMAIPMMSTRFTQIITTFISMVVLAQLGHTVLAASFTIGMYRVIVLLIFFSVLFSLGAIVGRHFAEKAFQSLSPMLWQAWLVGFLISLPIIFFSLIAGPLMHALHQPQSVIPFIQTYFLIFAISAPGNMLAGVHNQFLSGLKKQQFVTLNSILMLCISTFFNVGLVLGMFGLPKLGVAGSAWAAVITSYSAMLFSGYYLFKFMPCKIGKPHFAGLQYFKKIFSIGLPISYQTTSEMLGLLVITVITGWFGEVAMGASQISNEYMLMVLVPIFGLSEANTLVVTHSVGEKDHTSTRLYSKVGILLAFAITLFFGIVFAIFHQPLADLFIQFDKSDAHAIYELAMILLAIRIVRMVFDSITMVYTGSLRGLYDTKYAMWVSILTQWVLIFPLTLGLSLWAGLGVIGIAIASVLARIISSVLLHRRWAQKLDSL